MGFSWFFGWFGLVKVFSFLVVAPGIWDMLGQDLFLHNFSMRMKCLTRL